MTEKNEARVRTRAPMVPIGAKTLLSLLMAVVMLVGLLPVTALAADTESHPIKVGRLKDGKEMRVSYRYNDLTYSAYFSDEKDGITGSTPDEKWASLKEINSYLPDGSTERCKVVGWSYYDPDSGRFYHKGTVQAKIDFVYQASTTEDTLTFIVDSNLTAANGLYSKSEDTGLKNLNIELRNGATLTINGGVWKSRGDYQTAAALDITRTEEMGTWDDYNRTVSQYGDLTLKGNGTLKVNVPDEECVLYGICANNISIKDNVSLDIKTIGNTFKYSSSGDGVMSAAIFCYGYLNIDTTGTVNIVCQKAPSKPNVNNPNSYNALDWVGERIYLTNAQSVTLNVVKKEDTFVTGGRYRLEHYNAFVNKAKDNGWTVTETADDDTPYIVTMTREAMPTAAQLTVGTQTVSNATGIPNVTLTGGEYVSLKASVELPTWLSNMVTGSNARAKVGDWFLKIFEGQKLVGETIGGYNNSINVNELPEVSIGTTGFKPEAGKTYTVYACIPIVTKDGGKQLGSASVIATIKAVEKQKTFLNAVELTQDGKITTANGNPNVSVAAGNPYEITDAGSWTETTSGSGVYTRTVTLKIKDATSYGFMGGAKVNVTGGGDVTATNGSVTGTGDTMTTTLTAYKYYSVKFGGNEAGLVRAGDGVEAPAYTGTVEDGKEFKGWQAGEGGTIYAPGTTIFPDGDMTLTAVFEDLPETPEPVYQFSLAVGEENKPRVQFEQEEEYNSSTGTNTDLTVTVTDTSTNGAKLTGLTAKFSDTKFKGNNKWFELYTGTWDSDFKEEAALTHELSTLTFDENGKATFGVHLSRMKKTETDPNSNKTMPVGHCYAIIELTATYEGGGEVKGNLIVELTVNERTEYGLKFEAQFPDETSDEAKNGTTVLVNGTSGVYNYSGNADRGDVVTIKAVPADGLEFVQWKETNIAPENAQVKFTNDTSAETSFIMPKYSVELTAVYKTSTHTHDYGTTYTKLDDTRHYQTCTSTTGTCNEPMKVEEHTFSGAWTAVANTDTHKRTCTASGCAAEQTENHNWAIVSQTDATLDHDGKINYKCNDCAATKQETVAKLEKINKAEVTVTAPVRGAAPTNAAVKDTETRYYVADTEWTPDVTDKFASSTKYTVKVTLEAYTGYAFKGDGILGIGDTTFTINGNKAKVVSSGAQQVVITYEFPATAANYYYAGSGGTTTAKPEKSPGTGDPGVMLYAAMGLLSLSGGAWVVGKKRKDK